MRSPDEIAERLRVAGCVAAEDEAGVLVGAAPDAVTLDQWLHRREAGEPLAWITGTTVFCGRTRRVAPGVYVPRPHTEELAVRAASLLPAGGRAADLCTGSGAVAAHLADATGAVVVGVDLDRAAVLCARSNGVRAVAGDLAAPLRGGAFHVVTAVAPYVPSGAVGLLPADVVRHEPRRALDGGADGLDVVRRVIAGAGRIVRPGGWLLLEVGGDQPGELGGDLDRHGFDGAEVWHDDDGDVRGLAARRVP